MMDGLIDRMARALMVADGHPRECLIGDGYLARARCALNAAREPTNAMANEGRFPAEDDGPVACWQAMIDAALAEA